MRLHRQAKEPWSPPEHTPEEQELVERLTALTESDELVWTRGMDEWYTALRDMTIHCRLYGGSVSISDSGSSLTILWCGMLPNAVWAQADRRREALRQRAADALA